MSGGIAQGPQNQELGFSPNLVHILLVIDLHYKSFYFLLLVPLGHQQIITALVL